MLRTAHEDQCAYFGVTPLTEDDFARMRSAGLFSLEAAFSIASDLDAGFSFTDALEAYNETLKA